MTSETLNSFEFARQFNLPIVVVIQPPDEDPINADEMESAVPASGEMVNSGPMTGTLGEEAFDRTIEYIEERGVGKRAVNYRLRDWLISRQRYWGARLSIAQSAVQ